MNIINPYRYGGVITAPSFVSVGTVIVAGGVPSSDVPYGTGYQALDIAILLSETAGNSADLTTPTNGGLTWTVIGDTPVTSSATTTGTKLQGWWTRLASGSETAPNLGTPGNHLLAAIMIIRGCITTGSPISVTEAAILSSASANVSIPGDTTPGDQQLVIAVLANAFDSSTAQSNNDWANGNLVSITQRINANTLNGNGGGLIVATGVKAVAGNYGASTLTIANAAEQAKLSFALKAA